ncbi:ABC transporter permease [Kineococcus gypseus]|uniref:ABC transporter permease n=1 Tax=Kineococcus gypseus TaxID=1637102 RepID=UPI003D7EA2DE
MSGAELAASPGRSGERPAAPALDLAPRGGAAPFPRRTARQAGLEARVALRNGEQLLLTLVLPVIVLVAAVRATAVDLGDGPRPALALAGVLALAVVSTAFTGQAIATGFDRRNGVLRLLATTPLGRTGLLAGKAGAVALLVAVQVVVLCAVAALCGWDPDPLGLLAALPALVLGSVAFTALALLLAGTVRAEATLAAANFVWVLLLAGGGLVLPSPAPALTSALPSGALGTALRSALTEHAVAAGPLLVLLAWAVAATAASARWFSWE